jgi:colanic acid/amylovoran biosynthesis protein
MIRQNTKTRVCLLGVSFETGNMGVNALTYAILRCVLAQLPDAEIAILGYAHQPKEYDLGFGDTNTTVRLVNMRFSKKYYLKNNIVMLLLLSCIMKLVPIPFVRRRIIENNVCLRTLQNADIVADISAGDSFSDIYGMRAFFYGALPKMLAIMLKKNLILLPQTIGPFKRALAKAIAEYILNRASIVYSRERNGLGELVGYFKNGTINEKVRFCCDVGFALEPAKPNEDEIQSLLKLRGRKCIIIGVNISGLLYNGGYTRNNMFGLMVDYRQMVLQVITLLMRNENTSVLLVPHAFHPPEHIESDQGACAQIYDALRARYGDRIELVRGTYNQSEIKYIIGMCDFFIGSRMHACIAALSQNIPTVAIAYSKKFKGVMDSIGVGNRVADPREMQEQEILNIISKAYEERETIKSHLEQTMPEVTKRVLNLFAEIQGCCVNRQ